MTILYVFCMRYYCELLVKGEFENDNVKPYFCANTVRELIPKNLE